MWHYWILPIATLSFISIAYYCFIFKKNVHMWIVVIKWFCFYYFYLEAAELEHGKKNIKCYASSFTPLHDSLLIDKKKFLIKLVCLLPKEKVHEWLLCICTFVQICVSGFSDMWLQKLQNVSDISIISHMPTVTNLLTQRFDSNMINLHNNS